MLQSQVRAHNENTVNYIIQEQPNAIHNQKVTDVT
jgi:hypothetical protein